MRIRVISILALFAVLCTVIFSVSVADGTTVTVTANLLNGRASPTKKAKAEALFDKGDVLEATGKWSKDRKWIEIYGGETGVVWCDARYISETAGEDVVVCNMDYPQIKIRKTPVDGRVVGYLKRGHEVHIDRVVLGWGHCDKGWIDMSLVYKED